MTDKRELLKLCEEVLAEWEGEFHEDDGKKKKPHAEAVVARALKSLLTDREGFEPQVEQYVKELGMRNRHGLWEPPYIREFAQWLDQIAAAPKP